MICLAGNVTAAGNTTGEQLSIPEIPGGRQGIQLKFFKNLPQIGFSFFLLNNSEHGGPRSYERLGREQAKLKKNFGTFRVEFFKWPPAKKSMGLSLGEFAIY